MTYKYEAQKWAVLSEAAGLLMTHNIGKDLLHEVFVAAQAAAVSFEESRGGENYIFADGSWLNDSTGEHGQDPDAQKTAEYLKTVNGPKDFQGGTLPKKKK